MIPTIYTCLTNHMGSIPCHITALVISSLNGGCTHTQTHAHTGICKEISLRNQASAGPLPVCTWFNDDVKILVDYLKKMKLSNYKLFLHQNVQ